MKIVEKRTLLLWTIFYLIHHSVCFQLHHQHSAFRSVLFFHIVSWFVLKLPHPPEVAVSDLL
jgi:hypothetical protein